MRELTGLICTSILLVLTSEIPKVRLILKTFLNSYEGKFLHLLLKKPENRNIKSIKMGYVIYNTLYSVTTSEPLQTIFTFSHMLHIAAKTYKMTQKSARLSAIYTSIVLETAFISIPRIKFENFLSTYNQTILNSPRPREQTL